jgi:hypothetical protein
MAMPGWPGVSASVASPLQKFFRQFPKVPPVTGEAAAEVGP